MEKIANGLSPPHRLAVAYAPAAVREGFSLLLALDARLAQLVANASEPLIGQMKLAWWRDAIAMEQGKRPKGEPLLAQLAMLDERDVAAAMLRLVDAWEGLLVADGGASGLKEFAKGRGQAIFGSYAAWVGSTEDTGPLGADWAIADLTGVTPNGSHDLSAFQHRKLRPLTIMALSLRNVSGPRLLWHALTGR